MCRISTKQVETEFAHATKSSLNMINS